MAKSVFDDLDGYLDRKYQWSMGTWTRASIETLARNSGRAGPIVAAHGEDALKEFLDKYFYQSVPHFDKNPDERPMKKRARVAVEDLEDGASLLERARKRHRVDPAAISDDEIGKQWLRCKRCFKPPTSRDACYMIHPSTWEWDEYHVHCAACWDKEYASSICADCGLIRADDLSIAWTNYGPDHSELYLCDPCCNKRRPPPPPPRTRVRRAKK